MVSMYRGCTTRLEVRPAYMEWRRLGSAARPWIFWTALLILPLHCRPSPPPAGPFVARPDQRCATKNLVAWRHTRQTPQRRAAANTRAETGHQQTRISTTADSSSCCPCASCDCDCDSLAKDTVEATSTAQPRQRRKERKRNYATRVEKYLATRFVDD